MKAPLFRLSARELGGAAQAAVAASVILAVLLQLMRRPEAVLAFAAAAAVLFGTSAGCLRRDAGLLEFLLTRNVARSSLFLVRWAAGLIPLLLSLLVAASDLLCGLSARFWSLFVESGFTVPPSLSRTEALAWAAFALFAALWLYTVTFVFVAGTRDAGEMFLALLAAVAVFAALPLASLGLLALLSAAGLVDFSLVYRPLSAVWIVWYGLLCAAGAAVLALGLRWFEGVDL